MKKILLNIFAAKFLFNSIAKVTSDGLSLQKLKIIDKIYDKLEESVQKHEYYQLTKSNSIVENKIRVLVFELLGVPKVERPKLLETLLKDEEFDFNGEKTPETEYGFKELPEGSIKKRHWLDKKHPTVAISLEDREFEFLQETFSENSKFPENSFVFAVHISEAIKNFEEIK